MRLLSLTVENFGVFRGRQRLDLESSARRKGRNLTIVSGQNGAGKSTLFGAMGLALHGSVALGDRIRRQAYNDFLLSRLHKGGASSLREREKEAGVALSLTYVRSGRPTRVEVERRWRSTGRRVEETLTVLEDGSPPEGVEGEDLQAWLDDLVPPGLSPLCFFDAEKLDTLANPEQHDETLRDTVGRLLGLDLVGRLQEDLRNYTLSRGGGRLANRLRDEVLRHQAGAEVLAAQLEKAEAEAKDLDEEQAELEAELAKLERNLASEGGGYAARLPAMHKRLEEVQAATEEVSERLRELCADLLPFALAPEGCETLDRSLDDEADRHRRRLIGELWEERVAGAESALRDEGLWEDLGLPADARAAISARLLGALRATDDEHGLDEHPLIHKLSEQEHAKLKGWITRSSDEVPGQATDLSDRLRKLQTERKAIENDLQKTPDEDTIEPIATEILRRREALSGLGERRTQIDERLGLLRFQREEKGRELERAAERLAEAQSGERQMVLAERSKRALRAYEDALTRQQLTAVEEELVAAFNMVCRKEHLLSSARIDPETFRVRLHGADGGAFGLGDFSAGERQLYVMALLWALRRTSGRRLPLAVDTPLARLDEVHRHRLLHAYVPVVSEQVLLFTTDAELASGVLTGVEPYLSRVYRLSQDADEGYTEVQEAERPEPRGVLLYGRTENGHGPEQEVRSGVEVWAHDPEQMGTNGQRRRALLPSDARRLTLIDPAEDGYDWSRVAELERLTGASYISGKLRAGARVGELWQAEWTESVRKAGYDSVSAPGTGGTEEYVVNPSKVFSINASGENNGSVS